jgi:hypothetical protein
MRREVGNLMFSMASLRELSQARLRLVKGSCMLEI